MRHIIVILTLIAFCGACSPQRLSGEDLNEVYLTKTKGRVVRYDCTGKVTSDRTEVLDFPSAWMEFRPTHETTNLYSSSFTNTTTNSSPVITNYTQFEVTYEPDLLGARVVDGINDFSYSFAVCNQWSDPDPQTHEKKCLDIQPWEDGTFQINIHYQEKTSSGTLEVRPTSGECQPTPPTNP